MIVDDYVLAMRELLEAVDPSALEDYDERCRAGFNPDEIVFFTKMRELFVLRAALPQQPGECCRRALEDAAKVAEQAHYAEGLDWTPSAIARKIRALTPPAQAASPAEASGDEALVEALNKLRYFLDGYYEVPADLMRKVLFALAAKEPRRG